MIVDDKGDIARRLENLAPNLLEVDPDTLALTAKPWLRDQIKHFYREGRLLSLPKKFSVRLEFASRAFRRDWDLNRAELLDFLSLRRLERIKFGCSRILLNEPQRR